LELKLPRFHILCSRFAWSFGRRIQFVSGKH